MNNQTSMSPKNMFCNVLGSNKRNREPKNNFECWVVDKGCKTKYVLWMELANTYVIFLLVFVNSIRINTFFN